MPDRRIPILKLICLAFAAVLVYRIAHLVATGNPIRSLTVPEVPSLPVTETNNPAAKGASTNGTNVGSGKLSDTNQNSSTNSKPTGASATNSASSNKVVTPAAGTNSASGTNASQPAVTNTLATNAMVASPSAKTNAIPPDGPETNLTIQVTNASGSNIVAAVTNATNSTASSSTKTNDGKTNGVAAGKSGTNSPPGAAKSDPNMAGRPDRPGKTADVSPAVKGRVDRITQSEILGQVVRPLPMALLGIAGEVAFLRSPDGQTGSIKEGAELGKMKLLQIGTNRVLVELDGKKQELMIFSGFGSDTLIPKEKETKTNEPPTKAKSP